MTTVTDAGGASYYIPRVTTSTNLGPLPLTSFPSDCLQTLWDMNTYGLGVPWTYETQGCAVSTCCPSGNFYTEDFAWMSSYYSPGVCPSEYRACDPPAGSTALATSGGESIAFCCPENYACPSTSSANVYLFCQSLLSTSTNVVVLHDIFDQSTVSVRPFTLESGFYNSYQLAYPIQVRRKPGEPIATPPPSMSSAPSISSHVNPHGTTSKPTPSETPNPNHSLSGGVIAGIVIGAVVGLAIIGLLIWILIVLRRRVRGRESYDPATQTTTSNADMGVFPKSELPSPPIGPPKYTSAELSSSDLRSPIEVQGSSYFAAPSELPGSKLKGERLAD